MYELEELIIERPSRRIAGCFGRRHSNGQLFLLLPPSLLRMPATLYPPLIVFKT